MVKRRREEERTTQKQESETKKIKELNEGKKERPEDLGDWKITLLEGMQDFTRKQGKKKQQWIKVYY